MEMKYIFYSAGIFFLFLTIGFFIGPYLDDVPSEVKAIISFILAVLLFVLGDYLRRLNK